MFYTIVSLMWYNRKTMINIIMFLISFFTLLADYLDISFFLMIYEQFMAFVGKFQILEYIHFI